MNVINMEEMQSRMEAAENSHVKRIKDRSAERVQTTWEESPKEVDILKKDLKRHSNEIVVLTNELNDQGYSKD